MQWADICVMVLPCGRSANTEAGWMAGAGKRVLVYSPEKQEPELMYKIYEKVLCNIDELIEQFRHQCGDCDAFCGCGLGSDGTNSDDVVCQYFDDEKNKQTEKWLI